MLELFNGVKTENGKVLDSVVRFSGEEGIWIRVKWNFLEKWMSNVYIYIYIRFIGISPLGSRFLIKCVLRSMYVKEERFKLFISNFA